MKKTFIFTMLAVLTGALISFIFKVNDIMQHNTQTQGVACTMEARLCPDGVTYVGRQGPKCEFQACPAIATSTQVTMGDLNLGVGQSGKIGILTVTFNKFVQDSRCPIDVQCIQAGAVNTNVTLQVGPHLETKNFPSDEVPYVFEGYKISIVSIYPPRRSKVEIDPKDYRITFHIE